MQKDASTRSIIDLISLPSNSSVTTECLCQHTNTADKQYYENQVNLIEATKHNLEAESQKDILMIGLLNQLLKYASKIQELSKKQCLCQKDKQLKNMKSSYNFVKKQNHKLFKLLEQKNEECEKIKAQLSKYESTIVKQSRLVPIHQQVKIENHSKYFEVPLKDVSNLFTNRRQF